PVPVHAHLPLFPSTPLFRFHPGRARRGSRRLGRRGARSHRPRCTGRRRQRRRAPRRSRGAGGLGPQGRAGHAPRDGRALRAARATGAAAVSVQGAVPVRVDLPHEVHTLANGLRLIVHEDPSVPLVAVNLWYHVGSKDERPGRTGFAHLFEHLMFEGSAHAPEGTFDTLLESVGGVNNGSTSSDRTNYYEMLPASAL